MLSPLSQINDALPVALISKASNIFWEVYNAGWAGLLPASNNQGFGGLTLISVATGLNIALIKIEAFTKSLTDISAQLTKIKEEEIDRLGVVAAFVDNSEHLCALTARCEKFRKEIEAANHKTLKNCKIGAWWAFWGGITALFFQTSLGLLALALFIPTAWSWGKSWHARRTIREKVRTHIETVKEHLDDVAQERSGRENDITKSLEQQNGTTNPPSTPTAH